MSFPAHRKEPSISPTHRGAGFVVGADDGDALHWLGSLTLVKIPGAATGGGLDVVDHRVPAGYAPPPHVHRNQDELFYLLDGTLDVTCGDDHWRVEAGSLVFLPRGVPHGFTVPDDRPARTLLINAPAGFAEVVVELGTPAAELRLPDDTVPLPTPDRVADVSTRHGIEPPPSSAASQAGS